MGLPHNLKKGAAMSKKALMQIYKNYVPDIDKKALASMSKKELKSRIKLIRFCNKILGSI